MSGRVYQMVELVQPRCDLRFGIGTCPATGTPKCYNTWATCPSSARSVFNLDGEYKWRFVPIAQDAAGLEYSETDADHIVGRPLPCVRSISTRPTVINVGGIRKGESPFGIRSTITVDLAEFPWADRDGDFYIADRVNLPQAGFWQKFLARIGDAIQQMQVLHYVWYEGEAFSSATVSRFDLKNLVVNKGGCRLEGEDPLQRVEARKAQFPRNTAGALTADPGVGASVNVSGTSDAELSADYGNTGSNRYIRIGDEVVLYTGWTDLGGGDFTLTGVSRAQAGTVAEAIAADSTVQRVGRYLNITMWEAAKDLLLNHSTVSADLIDNTQWSDEGTTYLSTYLTDAWIPNPEDVNKLIGELCRDGLFQIWWDEREQLIKIRAVRDPDPGEITEINQAANLISSTFDRTPDDRITRVTVRYRPFDIFSEAIENYQFVLLSIDVDAEGEFEADGTKRELAYNSRWIKDDTNASDVAGAVLDAYAVSPVFATLTLDGKDRALDVGGFIDLTTPDMVDSEGRQVVSRWQIISWKPDWEKNTMTIRGKLVL